jgi:nuclear transport factor 2 (NTF2) superfamily protein
MVVPNREKSGNFINKKYSKSGNYKTIKKHFF